MLPPTPGLLSMMTWWPHLVVSFSATMRGIASAVPPAGKGTMMRIGFWGKLPAGACAWAAGRAVSTVAAAASRAFRRRAMVCLLIRVRNAHSVFDRVKGFSDAVLTSVNALPSNVRNAHLWDG